LNGEDMTKSEPQPSSKAPSAGPGLKRRPRLHKWAAALTHALFALTLTLTLVRNDTPRAAATDPDGTSRLRTEAAAKRPSGPEERLPVGDVPALAARPDGGGAAPVTDLRHFAAADPRAPAEASGEQAETTASPGAGELALAQKNRWKRDERPEPAPPPRPATEEEKARFKPLLDRLVAAYPEFLASHDGTQLTWKDGTRMPFDDGRQKTFEERLLDADLDDQMLLTYTPGPMLDDPLVDFDPGRIRSEAFFRKMYGDCKTGEVQKQLVAVDWLPKHGGKPVKVTPVNGVAEKLRRVSEELDALAPEMMKYLQPISGIFNCRNVSRTDRSSAHGFGIAVDINAKFGDYWQWRQPKRSETLPYRNQIPWEIAAIFEKHGFIWGGKWYHFDTLHFEYRPELIVTADEGSPQTSEAVPMPEKQPRNLN
jgi:D-alanyl-D-alanine carboxypeptidase